MSKKGKHLIIIACIGVVILASLPWLLLYGSFGLIAHEMNKTPDNSDDPLIPSGYVETDGEQGIGGSDWWEYNYYKYDLEPEFSEVYSLVDGNTDERLIKVLSNFGDNSMCGNLERRLSDGDRYYVAHINGDLNSKYGALMYYYDKENKILYRVDYFW